MSSETIGLSALHQTYKIHHTSTSQNIFKYAWSYSKWKASVYVARGCCTYLVNTLIASTEHLSYLRSREPALIEGADQFAKLRTHWLPLEGLASAQALETLECWIEECTKTHQCCFIVPEIPEPSPDTFFKKLITNDWAPVPKRILKVTDTHVYLQELAEVPDNYACLSHCWGPKGPSLRLTAATNDELSAGVAVQALPKVFRQAVQLCCRLSIRYPWIDAFCGSFSDRQLSIYVVEKADLRQASNRTVLRIGKKQRSPWALSTRTPSSQLLHHGHLTVIADCSSKSPGCIGQEK